MLSPAFQKSISERLGQLFEQEVNISQTSAVYGGSINQAFQLKTSAGDFFIKVNHADRFPKMFELEAQGLARLNDTGTISVPKVIDVGSLGNEAYLILPFEKGAPSANFWEQFGLQLAKLHRNAAAKCGLDHNNYIGSLPQSNQAHEDWVDFFVQERLEAQLRLARNHGSMRQADSVQFQRLFEKLGDYFPKEAPALLHGDLWSGNFLVNRHGEPMLIDPAVYYGHREMDLAMMHLFGGFEAALFEAYHAEFPLESDWENRIDLCNLYPLLVHVNLFGESYAQRVRSVLKRFV